MADQGEFAPLRAELNSLVDELEEDYASIPAELGKLNAENTALTEQNQALRTALESVATYRQEQDVPPDGAPDGYDWRLIARKQEDIARRVLEVPAQPTPDRKER